MKLNKSSYMKLCEAAWDISHDSTDRQMFLEYSPHCGWLDLKLYLNGWGPHAQVDTAYTLKENSPSNFSQACDPDDIAEVLQALREEAEE